MATLSGPRLPPARGAKPRRLVVLLHGYGADGNDLIGLAPYLQRALPDAAFVAPDGPEPCAEAPVGRQWFPIDLGDPAMMDRRPERRLQRYQAMAEPADRVAPLVDAFLDAELARHELTDDDLALVGFSQGTMLSLHVGLRRPRPPAAIVGFSGALLGDERAQAELATRVPVQLIHGDADDLVPPLAMFAAAARLGRAGLPVSFHISAGIGHGIAADGIDIATRFLVDAFAGRYGSATPFSSPLA